MVNGKQKGSQFERDTCVALSRFVDPEGTDTIYWRSAMSGGRATVQARKGVKNKTQLGDITCVHEQGSWLTDFFLIECKFYAKLDIEAFLFSNKGKLAGFWKKLRRQCSKNERVPLLIAKQNRLDTLLITTHAGLHKLIFFGSRVSPFIISRTRHYDVQICWFKDLGK